MKALGPRQAAVLEHLAAHPDLTAGELARAFGVKASLYKQLGRLEQMARIVGVRAWDPAQGRRVTRWHVAPPGMAPRPAPEPVPARAGQASGRDRLSRRARRAGSRGLVVRPGMEAPSLRVVIAAAPDFPGAACATADPDLFFPPDGESAAAQRRRVAKARAICTGCPIRRRCYEAADARGEPWGIWGGVDFDERRRQRRKAS